MRGSVDKKIPQANDLSKVFKLLEIINKKGADLDIIRESLGVGTLRQIHYYVEAAAILGLVDYDSKIAMTSLGVEFVNANPIRKKELILVAILALPIVKEIVAVGNGRNITKSQIAGLIEKRGFAKTTAQRRADTLINWFHWIEFHYPNICSFEGREILINQKK